VLEDIDERRSIQSFASIRSSRSSRSRRMQWASHRATTSVDSTVSETYIATSRRGLAADPIDGSYLNMGLADSRRASTKSRSYENVGSTGANASNVAAALGPSTSAAAKFTKQSSLPVAKPMLCPDYMSTNDSDVDLRHYTIPSA